MTSADELAFSRELRNAVPQIRFIDDNVWDSPQPTLAESIAACKTHFAFIWNPSLIRQLPVVRRGDGRYEGPNSGPVIQYVRSLKVDGLLRSGRIAAGFDDVDESMLDFANVVWQVLGKVANPRLVTLDGEPVPEYWAGSDAIYWLAADASRRMRDRSTETYYLPRSTPK
jgi:hypothetical protein